MAKGPSDARIRAWHKKAVDHGVFAGMNEFARMASAAGDLDQERYWYEQSAGFGDVEAMAFMALTAEGDGLSLIHI